MPQQITEQDILSQVISLEAYFHIGLKIATGLRKRLECSGKPAATSVDDLTAEQKIKLLSMANRRRIIKKKV